MGKFMALERDENPWTSPVRNGRAESDAEGGLRREEGRQGSRWWRRRIQTTQNWGSLWESHTYQIGTYY